MAPPPPPSSPPGAGAPSPLAPGHSGEQHHIDRQFGALANTTVQFHSGPASSSDTLPPPDPSAPCAARIPARFSPRQVARLRRRLFARRWMRQYFPEAGVLKREAVRAERKEEDLYLDLIVVAAIAALAHELRHHFDGWRSVENFVLLFGALYASWRSLMFLFNVFGTKGDLVDKATVFACQICMAGIGLGGYGAFTTARAPVGVAAFLAAAIPNAMYGYYSFISDQGYNRFNVFHQGLGLAATNIASCSPYFVAAFMPSAHAARVCYRVAFFSTQLAVPLFASFYNQVHAERPQAARTAVNVENMTEKFGVLTLVVLGESLMALLFEASDRLRNGETDVVQAFLGVFLGTVIIYSLMTLYFDVDNYMTKTNVHAIRHTQFNALLWSCMHLYYHAALAGCLSTGIGLMIKDVALGAMLDIDDAVNISDHSGQLLLATARAAAAEGVKAETEFTNAARWLFSGGWMIAIIVSSLMGLLHKAGKRGRTKNLRIYPRIVLALLAGIGMPFLDISAMQNLWIFTIITFVVAFVEFVAIKMDEIGMLSRRGPTLSLRTGASTTTPLGSDSQTDLSSTDSDEMDPILDAEEAKAALDRNVEHLEDADSQTFARRGSTMRHAPSSRRRRQQFETITHPDRIMKHCSQNYH